MVTEKQQLPEAPISITVMAYYAGFQVLITRRTGEQPIISQVPGIVALVNRLVEAGFEPARTSLPDASPSPENRENIQERVAPLCPVHKKPMAWKEGISQKTGKHYALWSCGERMNDGSFCSYKPPRKS